MHKTRKEKGELFRQYIPMTYNMAKKFSAKYGLPHGEMEDEAQGALALIVARWNTEGDIGSTDSPSTWIYQKLFWHLLTYCTRRQPKEKPFSSVFKHNIEGFTGRFVTAEPLDHPKKEGWLEGLMRTLGEDARIIADTILFAPAEIIEDIRADLRPKARERSRAAVEGLLAKQGWSGERFEAAWWELAVAL